MCELFFPPRAVGLVPRLLPDVIVPQPGVAEPIGSFLHTISSASQMASLA